MDVSAATEHAGATDPLQVLFIISLFVLAVGFVVLVLLRLMQVRDIPRGIRCLNCAGPLLPLLDASHDYHGEAACLRCGNLHEGVPWPRRRAPRGGPETSTPRRTDRGFLD